MADDIKSLEQKAEQSNIIDDDEFSFAENGQQYNQAKISRGAIVIATFSYRNCCVCNSCSILNACKYEGAN